ncbi:MAG: hypothetical protein ACI8P7_001105 [Candidatus Azotimanducaceae bacterium]|jgi:hypothetical protein
MFVFNLNNIKVMKKILRLMGAGAIFAVATANAQTARIQAIHNSADLAASTVDVYLDGNLLIDDFTYRTASSFIDAPAGTQISLAVAPSTSTSVADAIATFEFTLTANETYVLVAEGIVSPTGYNPATPFSINAYPLGREAASKEGNTDVLVHHGATDAPTVDVRERTTGITIVDDAAYGDFSGYLELPTVDFILDVQTSNGLTTVASYSAPLATLNLEDQALVVVASGFLNPAVNSNGSAFGLWVALPTGGALVELPAAASPTARVQVIHNSADLAASTVDVYLDGVLLIDDFAFRTASAFIDAPATQEISVAIAPSTSTSVSDAIATFSYNLAINKTYVLVAEGIVSPTGYSPATAFGISVYAAGREVAKIAGNTDVLVHHGATDAPAVDVYESSVPAGNIVTNASYGDFAGYLELATANYTLEVRPTGVTSAVASYEAPLATLNLDDAAIIVLASGFLDPTVNSNGPAFGLWVALPSGGPLVELPTSLPTGLNEINSDNLNFNVYPNPSSDFINIENYDLTKMNISITNILGKQIQNNAYNVTVNSINISHLVQGAYQITITNENKIVGHAKFVKY